MGESKTHFEQIPVEVVKKIATKLPAKEFAEETMPIDDDTADISTEGRVTSPEERGREIAQPVRQENPREMTVQVQEPIAMFDDERKNPPQTRRPKRSSDSGQDQS